MIIKTTYDLVDLFEETFSEEFKDKFDELDLIVQLSIDFEIDHGRKSNDYDVPDDEPKVTDMKILYFEEKNMSKENDLIVTFFINTYEDYILDEIYEADPAMFFD